MKSIFKFPLLNREKLGFFLLLLVAVTIPFQLKFGNMALIAFTAYNVIFFKKSNFSKSKFLFIIFPICFFLITIISSLFSKNQNLGLKHTDLEVLLIIISFSLVNQSIKREKIGKILDFFYYSTVVSTLILLLNAVIKLMQDFAREVVFHDFTALYDQHPVYFAMYLSFALFYDIQRNHSKSVPKRKYRWLLNSVLIVGILLCASKAIIFIDFVLISIYYIIVADTLKKRLISVFFLIPAFILILNIPFLNHRFTDGLRFGDNIVTFQPTNDFLTKKHFTYNEKKDISDLELRYVFGKLALYHIAEDQKILFGYGQGDVQTYLDYYYFSYNLGPNWYEDFNVHNQYLHILITYGIFVLLFFLSYLLFSIYLAVVNRNFVHLFFLILCCFVFFFEVVLVRNKGIIFFYFFNTLFLLTYTNFENSNHRHTRNS